MEHVTRVDLVPNDIIIAAVSGHHPQTGAITFVPKNWQTRGCHAFKIPDGRQVHENDKVSRHIKVMNHRSPGHGNLLGL